MARPKKMSNHQDRKLKENGMGFTQKSKKHQKKQVTKNKVKEKECG